MKFFQEITLLPGLEVGVYFLWKKLFQQIHLALVEIKNEEDLVPVGLSFPDYDEAAGKLGAKLRLFADSEDLLNRLNIAVWVQKLSDYTHVSGVRAVPVARVKEYASFTRWRGDMNLERLARRRAKRHNETFEQAMEYFMNEAEAKTAPPPPFIQMKSLSGCRDFRLFISLKKVEVPVAGLFTCYGLSTSERTVAATVPLF